MDLVHEDVEIYPHFGGAFSNASGLSTSLGVVENYRGKGSYSGVFDDMNAGWIVGIDHCYAPGNNPETAVQATSMTLAIPTPFFFGSSFLPSYGYGSDYYLNQIVLDFYPER